MSARASLAFVTLIIAGCAAAGDARNSDDDADELDPNGGEPVEESALTIASDLPKESGGNARFVGLSTSEDLIDVRGVGDSGASATHITPAPAPAFGAMLDRFDPNGASYRGDLSFMNFETVIANECVAWDHPYSAGRSYAFIARTENLREAFAHGFNLVGLSNNHSRDCTRTGEGIDGEASTAAAAKSLLSDTTLLHGVTREPGGKQTPAIGRFSIKGRTVRVALGSAYVGRASCNLSVCRDDVEPLMKAMQSADVDVRVLSLHSVDAPNQEELARIGARFVTAYGGDVVFGSGPHVWRPVQVLRKPNGKPGVVFESVGNFGHPGLATQAKNYVGRVLLDKQTLTVKEVQLVSITNRGTELAPSTEDPAQVPANVTWERTTDGRFKIAWSSIRD